ncbi:MAG: matrixin family metalloprotease, partial [Pirellulaceae bacterium]|nr:matrixin family metalloprotease [Pirellulaceae bacterium]
DLRGRAIQITADGVGSLVDLSGLQSFLDRTNAKANSPGTSTITVLNSAITALNPVLSELTNVVVTVSSGGRVTGNYTSTNNLIATTTSSVIAGQLLTDESAGVLLSSAIDEFRKLLPSNRPDLVALLNTTNIRIADLAGSTLGTAIGNTIYLDRDAAGWGWFIDATPELDDEFRAMANPFELIGNVQGIDLLTVVLHELGHVLGLEHDDATDALTAVLMQDTLEPGIRRKVSPSLVDRVLANWN